MYFFKDQNVHVEKTRDGTPYLSGTYEKIQIIRVFTYIGRRYGKGKNFGPSCDNYYDYNICWYKTIISSV